MAIGFDAITYGHDGSGLSSLSWSHTATGSDLLALVGVQGSTTADRTNSVTIGGNGMTKVTSYQGTGGRWISLWWAAVSAGSLSIVANSSSPDYIQAASATYAGCASAGQPDASHTNSTASATTLSDSVTPSATGCWLVMFTRLDSNGGPGNAGTATTRRLADPDWDSFAWFDSNAIVSAGSSQTLQCNAGGVADPIADIIISIAPVATSGTGFPFPSRHRNPMSHMIVRRQPEFTRRNHIYVPAWLAEGDK